MALTSSYQAFSQRLSIAIGPPLATSDSFEFLGSFARRCRATLQSQHRLTADVIGLTKMLMPFGTGAFIDEVLGFA